MAKIEFSDLWQKRFPEFQRNNSHLDITSFEYSDKLWKFEQEIWDEYYYLNDSDPVIRGKVLDEIADDKLKKRFMWLFNNRSFYNEVPGEMIFYILISLFTKDKEIFNTFDKQIKLNLHLFFIQNSRTGKDQALDFLGDIISAYNKKCHTKGLKPIKTYKLDGHETVESLIDKFAVEKGKITNKIVKGILSRFDLLLSPEASVYLLEKRGDKQTRSETLLQAMEGRPIEKSLSSWGEMETVTHSNLCLVAASRPIERMKDHIVNSGLQQRALNYMRDVTNEERKLMNKSVTSSMLSNSVDFKKEFKHFIDELIKLVSFIKVANIRFSDEQAVQVLINEKINEFFTYIDDEIVKPEHKAILESFVGNFTSKAFALAVNNALVHFREEVTKIDFRISFNILQKEFEQLLVWTEEKIAENAELSKERQTIAKSIKQFCKKPIKRKELAEKLKQKHEFSLQSAYKNIKRYSEGKQAIIQEIDKNLLVTI